MILPCRHVLLVLNFKTGKPSIHIMDFIHNAYKIEKIQQCVTNLEFVIPTSYQILPPPLTMQVEPPPCYNMKNKEVYEFLQGPGRRRIRRYASTGEFAGGRTSSPMKKATKHFREQCVTARKNIEFQNRLELYTQINDPIIDAGIDAILEPVVGPT
jgi:hypothetical protein